MERARGRVEEGESGERKREREKGSGGSSSFRSILLLTQTVPESRPSCQPGVETSRSSGG